MVAFLSLRMLLAKPFLLFTVLAVLLLCGVGYFLYQRRQKRRAEAAYRESSTGMIETRIAECQARIRENERELSDILDSMTALNLHLKAPAETLPRTRAETERLLASYEEERLLRERKIEFYRQCITKLQRIQRNHRLTQTLESEQAKLKRLQERHYDDIADLENLRTTLEYEQRYLETIDALSLRMLQSESPRDAQLLYRELDELTRDPE